MKTKFALNKLAPQVSFLPLWSVTTSFWIRHWTSIRPCEINYLTTPDSIWMEISKTKLNPDSNSGHNNPVHSARAPSVPNYRKFVKLPKQFQSLSSPWKIWPDPLQLEWSSVSSELDTKPQTSCRKTQASTSSTVSCQHSDMSKLTTPCPLKTTHCNLLVPGRPDNFPDRDPISTQCLFLIPA